MAKPNRKRRPPRAVIILRNPQTGEPTGQQLTATGPSRKKAIARVKALAHKMGVMVLNPRVNPHRGIDNAYGRAVALGYPYSRGMGETYKDRVWMSRFTKTSSGEGPALYIGYDEEARKWIIKHESEMKGNPRRGSRPKCNPRRAARNPKSPLRVVYLGPPSQAYAVFWHDQLQRTFPTKAEAQYFKKDLEDQTAREAVRRPDLSGYHGKAEDYFKNNPGRRKAAARNPGFFSSLVGRSIKDTNIKPGMWVKVRFTQPGKLPEHMWVQVTRVKGATLHGYLDNEPANLTRLHRGDAVTVKRSKVEEVIK